MKYSTHYNLTRQANKRKAREKHYHSVNDLKDYLDEYYSARDVPDLVGMSAAERRRLTEEDNQKGIVTLVRIDGKRHEQDFYESGDEVIEKLVREGKYEIVPVRKRDFARAYVDKLHEEHGVFVLYDDAYQIAGMVIDQMGTHNWALDNKYIREERVVNYILEDLGLLKTTREETNLYDGKPWTIFGWELPIPEIFRRAFSYLDKVRSKVDGPIFAHKTSDPRAVASLEAKIKAAST